MEIATCNALVFFGDISFQPHDLYECVFLRAGIIASMCKVQRVLCCVGMYPINVSFLYFNVTVDFNDSPLMAMCCYYRAFHGVLSWSHCLLNVCWPILETCVCTSSQSSWMSPTPDPQWVPVMLFLHSCLHCRPQPTGVGPGFLPPVQPGPYIQMIQRSSNAK